MNTTDLVTLILTLTAEHLDDHATITHPISGHQHDRCMTDGTLNVAVDAAADTVLRRNRMTGYAAIDTARAAARKVLPPVTGTVAQYANHLRALAT